MTEQTIAVLNLDCAACEERLERALGSLPGVERASASCLTETVTVRYDAQRVSMDALHRCVRRAGCALPGDDVVPAPRRTALLRSVFTALLLTLPLLWQLPLWMQLGSAAAVVLWPGRAALLRPRRTDMLAVLAAILLWALGIWRILSGASPRWFLLGGSTMIVCQLLGRYLESVRQFRTTEPVRRLMRLQPKTALTPAGDTDVETLQLGDEVLLKAGFRVPADGTLRSGTLTVDEHALTDVQGLTEKQIGDTLFAGSLIRAGEGRLIITALGEHTLLRPKARAMLPGRKQDAN